MSWFKKKHTESLRCWEVYPMFRWHRVASGWDESGMKYNYITESVLQYKASHDTEWRNIDTNTEVMPAVAKK